MSTLSASVISRPAQVSDSRTEQTPSTIAANDPRLIQLMKSLYQADQQVKYLHLQAEVDSLLQQLQILKQQRLTTVAPDAEHQVQ
ncbi:MAG TPA: hypothetical protein DDZ80_18895 [Cyanobacteria bacterium UBA8803]|nr:hypothetical protein [Cyanobacteria bacterium UBA9273]HBL60443.1 hypothetical protein [Cyanobacteria bacterium UBA8803]